MIRLIEVGPRDGLQNEKYILSPEDRVSFVEKLSQTGLKEIEAGAFVSPKWVRQMENSGQVAEKLNGLQKSGSMNPNIRFSYLVPNEKGFNDAMNAGVKHIALFAAVSETFSKKNINCSIDESFERFKPVFREAKKRKIKVRGYLSTCFYCPFEGAMKPNKVISLTEKFLEMGAFEVSIGDTIGAANPKEVRKLLLGLKKATGLKRIAMHFHDTRGTALANILASLDLGVGTFDSSLGGLGGCPYAPGSTGNVATEDVAYMLRGMGAKTGVDLEALVKVNKWFSEKFSVRLHSKVVHAGFPKK